MARDTSGSKHEPQYAGTGVPADAADLSELGTVIAFTGNRKVGPTNGSPSTTAGLDGANTGRTTSSGNDVWEGLDWWDTDLKRGFVYTSGAWVSNRYTYREFTLSRSTTTDGTVFFLVPTEVTANASPVAFTYSLATTGADNGAFTLPAGIYLWEIAVHPGAAQTGTTYAQIRNYTSGGRPLARIASAVATDPWCVTSAIIRSNGTDEMVIEMLKTTGSTSNMTGFASITRLGGL